jgi:hypothetical protein
MKKLMILMAGIMMLVIAGCNSSCPATVAPKPPVADNEKKGPLGLSKDEMRALFSKDNVELSDSLKQRIMANSQQLQLTPEEMQVLKSTGKVILCGKCGYLLQEKKFKEFEKGKVINVDKNTGFAVDSLRERIIKKHLED